MTLELRVPPREQETPWSCWWAATAMVLAYYGRDHQRPEDLDPIFAPQLDQSPGRPPRMRHPTIDEAMAADPTLRSADEMIFMHPSEWRTRGLPPRRGALRLYAELTGMRALPARPAFGGWTGDEVEETLRARGPFVFFGWWSGFPHVLVVSGRIGDDVIVIDPARGFPTPMRLDRFNAAMGDRYELFLADGLNPFHKPDPRPVRETVTHPG